MTMDMALRGAAAGSSLILAAALAPLARRSTSARFGGLFALSAAAFAIGSALAVNAALPSLSSILKVPAMSAGVFFWWFALSLFCDQHRWHWTRLIPLGLVVSLALTAPLGAPPAIAQMSYWGTELINAVLMIHVMWIILNGAGDDLVEHRRKFRAVWVGAVALSIIAITIMHTLAFLTVLPQHVHVAQAALVMLVSCGVTAYCLAAQGDFFPEDIQRPAETEAREASGVAAADRHLASALRTAMAQGAYMEPGLTVGALANRLGAPEHRLRTVINQQLGYRNFAAFLNEHRVGAAKSALSDPAQARRQILQIALELGYGSIAPFNRAFRQATGLTPTAFRRIALERPRGFEGAPAE